MELEFSRQIFEIFSNTKFHENLSNGSRLVPCGGKNGRTDGQTDRQAGRQAGRQTNRRDEANNHVLQFCERILK